MYDQESPEESKSSSNCMGTTPLLPAVIVVSMLGVILGVYFLFLRGPSASSSADSKTKYSPSFPAHQRKQTMASQTRMIKEGQTVPDVVLKMRVRTAAKVDNPFAWKDMQTSEFFGNKRCVLFGLPGAFTPTCTNGQLPGYEEAYDKIRALGIDEVYCISVNDAFVMRQWGLKVGLNEDCTPGSLGFQKVKLLPDGAALFTRGMGMSCTWGTERGFGERSWRYSAVLNHGTVEKLFVEQPFVQNSEADPFEVSDAATMLAYLAAK